MSTQSQSSSSEGEPGRPPLSERLGILTVIGPPTTVIAAVLLWYGYVATYQRFKYFGVYLELADLSNQELLFYGAETILPFSAIILGVLLLVLGAHLAIPRLMALRWTWARPAVLVVCGLTGLYLLCRAVVGILVSEVSEQETPGVTPLSLTFGAPLLVYVFHQARRRPGQQPERGRTELAAIGLATGIAITGLFWTATSFAGSYGQGRGYRDALQLPRRPEVVLRTKEPIAGLHSVDRGKREKFRYEYRGLRLLLESHGRLFLVPAHWTSQSSTVIVPYDSNIQIQLYPARREPQRRALTHAVHRPVLPAER